MIISNDALKENTQVWQRLGAIAPGGTVFGVGISPVAEMSRCWAATGCGMFYSDDSGLTWTQSLRGLTTPLLSALAVAPNGALFAGALGGDLFSSFDWGQEWQLGSVPRDFRATITALLASPNFTRDGTIYAATDGEGLLVSRNSNKSWEDSSFGLGDNSVLALAAPSDWSQREVMFAATPDGVYVSQNGGRAWRETELILDDDAVDTLAVSPDFDHDRTVYAGTEKGSLYRSTNGGRTWDLLVSEIGDGPVNCLWLAPDFAQSGRMVAGVGAVVHLSTDKGETWQAASELPGAVLSMAGNASYLLVGLHDAGVWKSTDGGATWASSAQGLAARGFARLIVAGNKLYALGPQEGLWVSQDGGQGWRSLPGLAAHYPLTAAFVRAEGDGGDAPLFLTSQESGILRSADGGSNWTVVCDVQGLQTIQLAPGTGNGWAGSAEGKLWATQDGGVTWQSAASPCEGQEILSIVVSPTFAQDRTLLMGTAIPASATQQARIALWRSTDAGANWKQVTTQATAARWIDISMPVGVVEGAVDQAVLATGPFCLRPLRRAKDVWISTRVDPNGANTLGVVILGEIDRGGMLYAATGTGIYRSIDGGRTWQPFSGGMNAESYISITAVREGEKDVLYAVGLGGSLWKRELN